MGGDRGRSESGDAMVERARSLGADPVTRSREVAARLERDL